MKISELSSPELRHQFAGDSLSFLLSHIESLIEQTEHLSPENPFPANLTAGLRQCQKQLSHHSPVSDNSIKLQIWKLSYRLWNACVDLSNAAGIRSSTATGKFAIEHAEIRQVTANLLSIAGDVSGVPSPALKASLFYYKTGLIWHNLKKFDLAINCFEKATDLTSKIEIDSISDHDERKLLLDINIARSKTAWEVSDRNVSITLLNRSKKFLFETAAHYKKLADQYLMFGKALLSKNENLENNEALKLMNEALELCEKGLRVVKKTEETLSLKVLRDQTLRFIAAVHLQREEFESVIKCVRVLREGTGRGSELHPSLSVLAMKAWLGLERVGEAEKELRGMVVNKGIPEGVWVSAMEAYFKAVGVAGVDTVKSVFMGLLGRCQVSASAAVRVVNKVVGEVNGDSGGGGMEGLRGRAKMAAEVVADERVVALFASKEAEKERTAMHAILWNCAAAHFRSKDYKISTELFEKSLLYAPSGTDSRILRAKGFRVLCLCHLGLSQLDQAQEYIDEAEKFKIYLQKNDHDGAMTQIQSIIRCTDFTTEFLLLAAHEAMACQALSVAISSLSNLLNFYSPGHEIPITEIILLRTITTILMQEPEFELEVLKFMMKAQSRAAELGPDAFFGKGEVGKRERNWFAMTSWNVGIKCGGKKKYELCAEFMRLASVFYSYYMVDEEVEGNNMMVCKCIILTVSAMIAAEKQKKVSMSDAELKQAVELLDRAKKMLESLSIGKKLADLDNNIDPNLFFTHTLNAYELYGRLNDSTSQLLVVKNYANSKACTMTHLLRLGLTASHGPDSNPEVATFALNACLSSLLTSPQPDYRTGALTIRRLISVSILYKGDTDDDVVYNMYKQAYRIMVGLKEGEYPGDEGKWLATTAWNRGSIPVRLGQVDVARKWVKMGLDLAKKVQGMETYVACMEDYVSGFEKKINDKDQQLESLQMNSS